MSTQQNERLRVLQLLEEGRITVDEAERLLSLLPAEQEEPSKANSTDFEVTTTSSMWLLPLALGLLITIPATWMAALILHAVIPWGWTFCVGPWLLFGLTVIGIAIWSRKARWVHIRLRSEHLHLHLGLPVPLRLIATLLRILSPYIPALRETGADEVILALDTATVDAPLQLEIDETDTGEHIQIVLG